jgi:polyphosphate:AMP phosphotransferase
MLDKVNLQVQIPKDQKEAYKKKKEALALELGACQRKIKELGIPVLILFEGWDAAGKGTLINDLMIPLDPRSFSVFNCKRKLSDDEINRPYLWRYWTKTPRKGQMVILDGSYYAELAHREDLDALGYQLFLHEANEFEETLSDSGTIIIKFFVHISKKEQKKRFKKLADNSATSWRVTDEDWRENENYDHLSHQIDKALELTDTGCAPWHIIEGQDKNYACMKVYTLLAERLNQAIADAQEAEKPASGPLISAEDDPYRTPVLAGIDMTKTLDKKTYKQRLKECQKKIRLLEYEIYRRRIPVVVGFEGWDAGGKGGAIKRLCENLDPRGYQVYPTAAPTKEELDHNWLWRFWQTVPKRGHFSIYDRTWYGRVMVEPIEGFCTRAEYDRAFSEINAFEKQLTDYGAVVLKFWMNITKDEQEKRFKERQADADKQWKITDEDWRNRDKWDAYVVAVDRMLIRTSTEKAPWIVVEGNDKYFARIRVLQAVIDAIEHKIAEFS